MYGDSLALFWIIVGFEFPPLMDEPHKSRSVRDFWKRWDTVIQKLLFKFVYKPSRQIGLPSIVAVALTFIASGLVHVLPIIVSLGKNWRAANMMMGYFIVQLSIMLLEKPLKVETWSSQAQVIWTAVNIFAPSYLLVAPCLELTGIKF